MDVRVRMNVQVRTQISRFHARRAPSVSINHARPSCTDTVHIFWLILLFGDISEYKRKCRAACDTDLAREGGREGRERERKREGERDRVQLIARARAIA